MRPAPKQASINPHGVFLFFSPSPSFVLYRGGDGCFRFRCFRPRAHGPAEKRFKQETRQSGCYTVSTEENIVHVLISIMPRGCGTLPRHASRGAQCTCATAITTRSQGYCRAERPGQPVAVSDCPHHPPGAAAPSLVKRRTSRELPWMIWEHSCRVGRCGWSLHIAISNTWR